MALQIYGVDELSRRLSALGSEVGGKALRSAIKAAIVPAVDAARAAAPVGSVPHYVRRRGKRGPLVAPGYLQRSIRAKITIQRDKTKAMAIVGMGKQAYYGSFTELGAPAKKMPARGWLEGSFARSRQRVVDEFIVILRARVAEASKK